MKCLWCMNELIHDESLSRYLLSEDCLCDTCRSQFQVKPIVITIDNVRVYSHYVYDDFFKQVILQYKEAYDEALCRVFDYQLEYIKKMCKGYTIVLAPSSLSRLQARGFHHVKKMVEGFKLPVLDVLYKKKDITLDTNSYQDRLRMQENIGVTKDMKCIDKIVIVDDILTSGSTIKGCKKALSKFSKNIIVFTFAYNLTWQNEN